MMMPQERRHEDFTHAWHHLGKLLTGNRCTATVRRPMGRLRVAVATLG